MVRRFALLFVAGVMIVAAASWTPAAAAPNPHHRHHGHHASPARTLPICEGAGPIIPGPPCAVPQF